jgi:magnesium transporter
MMCLNYIINVKPLSDSELAGLMKALNLVTQIKSDPILDENNRAFCAVLTEKGTKSLYSNKIDGFTSITEQATIAWIDYIIDDFESEGAICANKVCFSEHLVKRLLMDYRGSYEDFDIEMGLLIPAIHADGLDVNVEPLILLLKDNLLLTIHTRKRHRFYQMRRYAESYFKKLPKNMKSEDLLTLLMVRIIDENNSWNFKQLQEMDERSDDLTMDLKNENVIRAKVGDQIYQQKHALLTYLSALWGTADTLSSLRYGDADLISDSPQVLDKVALLQNEVHQQLSLAEHLSEVLASGLECLQSIYNNQLQDRNNQLQDRNNQLQDFNNNLQSRNNELQERNNQLQDFNNTLSERNNELTATNNKITLLGAFLAIIGAGFFVPNTIATVLSQTNIFLFSPNDTTWYISLILASTIITTGIVYWWVKRVGLLPNISDDDKK